MTTIRFVAEVISWPLAVSAMMIFVSYAMLNIAATLAWAILGFRLFGVAA